jgi:hypothetical protein
LLLFPLIIGSYVEGAPFKGGPPLFEGRIPIGTKPAFFDGDYSPYKKEGAKGPYQTWSQIITTDYMKPSPYDEDKFQSFQITINDQSVFPGTPGYRRATLYPKLSETTYIATGIVTYHFSIMKSPDLQLNTTHQYEFVNLGGADGQPPIFQLRYGTDYQNTSEPAYASEDADKLRIYATSADDYASVIPIYSVDFKPDVFYNFAVTIDWNAGTLTIFYSEGSKPLAQCRPPTKYFVQTPAGFSLGLLKYPIGVSVDPAQAGYQEEYIDEGIIFGGVFIEDRGYFLA